MYLELVPGAKHTCSRVWSNISVDGPESMSFFDLDHQPAMARGDEGPDPVETFRTRSIPPLFSVCRESYSVAIEKIYTKSFASDYALPATWFNFELDILYLDRQRTSEYNDDGEIIDVFSNFDDTDISADIKKVQNLAMYIPQALVEFPAGELINETLSHFGNVRDLVLVPTQDEREDCAELAFLEFREAVDGPEYQHKHKDEGYEDEERLHPVVLDYLGELVRNYEEDGLWKGSKWLWDSKLGCWAANYNNESANALPKWKKPYLQSKPIISRARKIDLMQRKQKYNRDRDAEKLTLTITAEGYNSLEVSVPLLTTIAELISIFCDRRGIDINEKDRAQVKVELGLH